MENCWRIALKARRPSTYNVTFNCNTEISKSDRMGCTSVLISSETHRQYNNGGKQDGIYSNSCSSSGYSGNYIFLNNPNDGNDWGRRRSRWRNVPMARNDRLLPTVTEDTTLSTCYGRCSTEDMTPSASVNVTLRVDMNDYPQSFGFVNLSGI